MLIETLRCESICLLSSHSAAQCKYKLPLKAGTVVLLLPPLLFPLCCTDGIVRVMFELFFCDMITLSLFLLGCVVLCFPLSQWVSFHRSTFSRLRHVVNLASTESRPVKRVTQLRLRGPQALTRFPQPSLLHF